jgi:Ssp1 endopeptidase immunity protein Rap1a
MRKTIFAMVASLMLLVAPVIAQKETSLVGIMRETGQRVSLVDGNQLYAWCQDAQDTFKIEADNSINIRPGSGHSAVMYAASCWAYIEGIVDGTPARGEFNPGENVRLSQYVDVVFAFLKTHPESRDKMGVTLVQTALCEAFHK